MFLIREDFFLLSTLPSSSCRCRLPESTVCFNQCYSASGACSGLSACCSTP